LFVFAIGLDNVEIFIHANYVSCRIPILVKCYTVDDTQENVAIFARVKPPWYSIYICPSNYNSMVCYAHDFLDLNIPGKVDLTERMVMDIYL
jgi:hypothetical protein